jgi:hypothetical protein
VQPGSAVGADLTVVHTGTNTVRVRNTGAPLTSIDQDELLAVLRNLATLGPDLVDTDDLGFKLPFTDRTTEQGADVGRSSVGEEIEASLVLELLRDEVQDYFTANPDPTLDDFEAFLASFVRHLDSDLTDPSLGPIVVSIASVMAARETTAGGEEIVVDLVLRSERLTDFFYEDSGTLRDLGIVIEDSYEILSGLALDFRFGNTPNTTRANSSVKHAC